MKGGKVCNQCQMRGIVRLFRTEKELKSHKRAFHRSAYFSGLQEERVKRGGY